MSNCTVKEILAELKRELAMRHRVFPDWVHTGRLSQTDSDQRIELMAAAIELIEANNKPDQQSLFSETEGGLH